jgi:hypothetical protein
VDVFLLCLGRSRFLSLLQLRLRVVPVLVICRPGRLSSAFALSSTVF